MPTKVKVNVIAKIDGDQLMRAVQLPGMEDVEIGIELEVTYKGCTATTDSMADCMTFLKLLAQPPKPAVPADPTKAPHE